MPENYNDLVDHAVIERARTMHDDSIARLNAAEADLDRAKVQHAAAEAAANLAATGDTDVLPLDAEHDLSDAAVALASAIRVRDAAVARRARTELNIHASENVAWRPVGIAAARARLAACEKFTRAQALLVESDAEYQAANTAGQAARARGFPTAESGLGHARPLAEERLAWGSVRQWFDLDAGTFAGPPTDYIA